MLCFPLLLENPARLTTVIRVDASRITVVNSSGFPNLASPEVENDRRGINTRMGMRRCLKDGRWTGMAPKGYKNGKDGFNKPLIVPNDSSKLVKEAFELFSSGLYSKEELRKMMFKKGLKLGKSQFPKFLENPIYNGKLLIPEFGNEEAQIIVGLHEPIISNELFFKVQRILKIKTGSNRKHYNKVNEETPLRSLLNCSICGRKLTSSKSKGRKEYYTYYHCRNGCKERIKAEVAHESLLAYFKEVKIAPEIEELYLVIMEEIFKSNEVDQKKEIKKLQGQLNVIDLQLDNLEIKNLSGEIAKDSYLRMKPKLQDRIEEFVHKIDELESSKTNFLKYLKFGVNLIQNLDKTYLKASFEIKQKIVGSIFPENLIIENNKCRTTRENEVIVALNGFERDLKKEKVAKKPPFPVMYPAGWIYRTLLMIFRNLKS